MEVIQKTVNVNKETGFSVVMSPFMHPTFSGFFHVFALMSVPLLSLYYKE